jgi:hypothetical protein
MAPRRGHVHHADVEFAPDADSRAPGGEVTLALCGAWEHEGDCRWPHHTSVDTSLVPSPVRVVYVVSDEELDEVRGLIERALSAGDTWRIVSIYDAPLTAAETKHAARLGQNS